MSSSAAARPGAADSRRDLASERLLAGIGLMLLALMCFAMLDASTKISVSTVPVLMGVWFRYAFQAVATTVFLLPMQGTAVLRTAHPKYHVLRGALLLTTSILAFFSLRYMPLAEFTSIVLIAPLVIGAPPINGVTMNPASNAPTIPTTMFRMMPCWPSVRMIMLATQPISPPTTRSMIRPMFDPSIC